MSDTIILRIEGSALSTENVAGWEAEVFRLDDDLRGRRR